MSIVLFLGLLVAEITPCTAAKPIPVTFASGSETLKGYIYRPAGKGPFPLMIWNHGNYNQVRAGQVDHYNRLQEFFTNHGYVFFTPFRHNSGVSPGYSHGETDGLDVIAVQELYNKDVEAAVSFGKALPYVDVHRVVMSGVSVGGIQTILAAEKGLSVSAFVPFAPGAMSWDRADLRKRLAQAVKKARAPIFLLQAANDFSTGPYQELGQILSSKRGLNQARLYKPYGQSHYDGHHFFAVSGCDVWGKDVVTFLNKALVSKPAKAADY